MAITVDRRPGQAAAVALVFFLNGAVVGDWVPHIPEVAAALHLSPGLLGTALLATAVGSLCGMPLATVLVERSGSRVCVVGSAVAYSASIVLPGVAGNAVALGAGLFGVGLTNAVLDLAMNRQGAALEARRGRSTLPWFHASFSVGSAAGGGLGAAAIALGLPITAHLVGVAIAGAALALLTFPHLLREDGDGGRAPGATLAALLRPGRTLVLLATVAFCALLVEGAVADWGALLLRGTIGAAPATAGAGFVIFTSMMVLGRALGSSAAERLGPARCVRAGGALAALGALGAAFGGARSVALCGFAVLGLGLAAVFPLVISASGRVQGMAGTAIGTVSLLGYFGFLAGPPLVGYLAEITSLPTAFAALSVLGLVIAVGAPLVSTARGAVPA